jgi:hypothetical protein
LFWGASIIGGIIFGIGMALAGGCAAGVSFKTGTGLLGFLIACLGVASGGLLAKEGFLKSFQVALKKGTKITIEGANPTLASLLDINPWIVVIILTLLFVWLLRKIEKKAESSEVSEESTERHSLIDRIFRQRWSPVAMGIGIGLIQMLAFVSSSAAGRNYPLGIVAGQMGILKAFLTGNFNLNWISMMILGLFLGAALGALAAGEFKVRVPRAKQAVIMFIGGLLMGIGAVTAAGCTVTHILSGIPQLSLGSMVAGFFMFLAAYGVVYFKELREL